MRRSTSRSSTSPDRAPDRVELDLGDAPALSVDVEEWYHNCWVEEFVDPAKRPPLPEELDRLLPELVERLSRARAKATFFVLGEVARRIPATIRALADAGHEVACHGEIHLRANDRRPEVFLADIVAAKARLEDLLGAEVVGFRAPEWSLRSASNPRFRLVESAGFRYDSSLMPAWGAGDRSNPIVPTRFRWPDGATLIEIPPLTWSPFRLPASGWSGRLLGGARLAKVAREASERGRLPLLVVHPWEVVARPCPGMFTGFARFFHDASRVPFALGFDEFVARLGPRSTLAERSATVGVGTTEARRVAARTEADFRSLPERAS